MTRAERAALKRRRQILKAKRRYRQRLKEQKAQAAARAAAATAKPEPVVKDPVWAVPDPLAPGQPTADPSGSPPASTKYDPRIEVDADGKVTVADPAGDADQKPAEEPKPHYIRRAARMKVPKPPTPLGDAVDPATGRRRVVIRLSDGRVIEGETRGGGGDAMPSASEILDWEF